MRAYLWDGIKQISGNLNITDTHLQFILEDFKDSNLNLIISRANIQYVNKYRIFGILDQAIEVISKDGTKDIFVVEEGEEGQLLSYKEKIENTLLLNHIKSEK